MGAGASAKSTKLVKPDDCNEDVWKRILKLFDRLDTDGTHSIDETELMGHIADLHSKNNIRRLNKKKEDYALNTQLETDRINYNKELQIQKLNQDAKSEINELTERNKLYIENINKDINSLESMSEEEKAKKIKSIMCGKKDSIEFWDFYKYMKNRTDDIPNIVW